MAAENLTVTIGTDTTQAELDQMKARVAAVDLAMYAEMVKAYRATLETDSGLFALKHARTVYRSALRMYSLFSGRDVDEIHFEMAAELG